MSCVCILEIKPLSVTSFANIFSHSVGFLFIFFLLINFWLCWVFVAVSLVAVYTVPGLLIAVSSLVAEHRL